AIGRSLAGDVNIMGVPSIDRDILAKITEVGATKFDWTEEEAKHVEATFWEHAAEIGGSLLPDLPMLVMMGQATNMLKAGTFIERLQKGYKIIRNPVLKTAGKSWKQVIGAKDAVPSGWNVLKVVESTPWQKAQGFFWNSLLSEAVFTQAGGFQLGTITGMNLAHGIHKINYKGKWGKIFAPYIDMVIKSGFGATVGMEAGAITGMAVESLMKNDVEFKRAWDAQWSNYSDFSKRILAEIMLNTIAFGGMHLVTNATAKKMNSPLGETASWYGS
ncbi:unnamed protein product, partial [marine sediment metagenome]